MTNNNFKINAYITNLGKYNEGILCGTWLEFPTTANELADALKSIGIGSRDCFGCKYEEIFITDYECDVDGIAQVLDEYESLDMLNYLANTVADLDECDYEKLCEILSSELNDCRSASDIINLCEQLDYYNYYNDIDSDEDIGYYFADECGCVNIPDEIKMYFDYEAYGRDIRLNETAAFTDNGFIIVTGWRPNSAVEVPDEYKLGIDISDLEKLPA